MRVLFTLLVILTFSQILPAQKKSVGLEGIYNFQTSSIGFGGRFEIPLRYFSVVPQVSYFPAFNKVSEFYAGASLHANVIKMKKWTSYGIIHGGFNGWLNYSSSPMKDAKFANWDAEAGLGLKTNGCIFPFVEGRYNFKWREATVHVGLAYTFGCKSKKGIGSSCPVYGDPFRKR